MWFCQYSLCLSVWLPVRLPVFLAFGWSKRFFEFLILVLGDTGQALSLSFVPVFACLLSCYVSFVTDGHVDSFLIRRQLLECMCVSFGPPPQRSSERPFTLYAIRIYNIYLPHFEKRKVERKCEQGKGYCSSSEILQITRMVCIWKTERIWWIAWDLENNSPLI